MIAIMPFIANAQRIFSAPHQAVIDTLTKYGAVFIRTDKDKAGNVFDLFKENTSSDDRIVCFYDENGLCDTYRRILDRSELITEIERFNKEYIKVDSKHWINKAATVKVELYIPDNNPDVFDLDYTLIK